MDLKWKDVILGNPSLKGWEVKEGPTGKTEKEGPER